MKTGTTDEAGWCSGSQPFSTAPATNQTEDAATVDTITGCRVLIKENRYHVTGWFTLHDAYYETDRRTERQSALRNAVLNTA